MKTKILILGMVLGLILACNKPETTTTPAPVQQQNPEPEPVKSSEKQITSFVFLLTNNPIGVNVVATIDEENKTITTAMPPGTDITGLLPEVKISELSTIDRDTAQDFTESLEYIVTAEDGSKVTYTITITALLTPRQILQLILDVNPENTLGWDLPNTADLGTLDGVTTDVEDNIVELAIYERKLSQLPAEIGQLTNLTLLRLGLNQLISIPPEIGQLTNLEYLSFYYNQITILPPEIGQLTNLKRLSLTGNLLTSLPIELKQLVNLRELYLGANNLSQFNHVPFIPSGGITPTLGCSTETNLEVLRLSGNPDLEVLDQCICDLDEDKGGTVNIDVVPDWVNCVGNVISGK